MDQLDTGDDELRRLAMLVCLILSAATSDRSCIESTGKLYRAGLLNVHKLAEGKLEEIKKHISKCGIQHKRAEHLVGMAVRLIELHDGRVPSNLEDLMNINGVGRKTAVLMRNEAFGFFSGIGTDKHVKEMSIALGFIEKERNTVTPEHAEAALRKWILQSQYKDTNKIFGSFAQLITQDFLVANSPEEMHRVHLLVRALCEYIHKPYHVKLLWFVIKRVRSHYKSNVDK